MKCQYNNNNPQTSESKNQILILHTGNVYVFLYIKKTKNKIRLKEILILYIHAFGLMTCI